MKHAPVHRQGDIYWLDDCPPLHGDTAKRRPVVVISTEILQSKTGDQLIVVACTSTVYSDDVEAIELPNRSQNLGASTGLSKRTWAIPRWRFSVALDRHRIRAGYVSGKLLNRIVQRYDFHVQTQRRDAEGRKK